MGSSEKSGKILQRAGGFVVIKISGEEAEIDTAKVGGQVSLERELVSGIQPRRWTRRIDKPVSRGRAFCRHRQRHSRS